MPLFEYQCKKCGHLFEELQKSASDKPPKCPKCKSGRTERQLSTFSASIHEGGGGCDTGSCSTGTCPTGTCPFG
jgi:putative FmdB family regulatory protein